MGLRINTNSAALGALRTLHITERGQARSLQRLSTGLRINTAADDPSGLVISEQLRAQISSLRKAGDNSQNAQNLINVADSALQDVSNLLTQIQDSVVFALNTGAASPEQVSAEQDAVDQAISGIDRIANTTRYADRALLNGSASYKLTASAPTLTAGITAQAFTEVHFRSLNFTAGATSRDLPITLTRRPQRSEIVLNGASSAASTIIRISGGRGTSDVFLGSNTGATAAANVAAAINSVAEVTGVFASATGGNVILKSDDFGNSQFISVEGVQGTLGLNATSATVRNDVEALVGPSVSPGTTITAGEVVSDRGLDGQVLFNGVLFTGVGRAFSINTEDASFQFKLNPNLFHPGNAAFSTTVVPGPGGAVPISGQIATLTVGNTGVNFQLRETPRVTDRLALGIDSVKVSNLGFEIQRDAVAEAVSSAAADTINRGGFLSTIKTGQGNDLTQNAGNAQVIVKAAINQVSSVRGFLGSISAFNIGPNIDALAVEGENLSASLSSIRDLDFAEETSRFTRSQILFQSGIAVLASANLIPQSVLTLLR